MTVTDRNNRVRCSVLSEILQVKAGEVADRAARLPLRELSARVADLPPCRDFHGALRARVGAGTPAVIAEIKRASPSAGLIREDFEPAVIAGQYESGGAACLSVLTDREFFRGHEDYLRRARAACGLPVLRKDFIVDAWQVYETRLIGADALLLIVAALGDATLAELSALGHELGLAVLVEVHDRQELERALKVPGKLLGINNRDLHRFETRLETSLELAADVSDERIVVAESGIHTSADIRRLQGGGINAFLIGESLMRAPDPGAALRKLTTNNL